MEVSLQCITIFFASEAQMPRLISVSCSSSIKDDRTAADGNRNPQHQLTEFSSTAFHLKPKANGAPDDAQGFPRVGALERLDFPEPDPAVGNNAYDVKFNIRVLHCTLAALFIIK
jgi:hypothetical protein